MGVDVAGSGVAAFVALIAAVVLIGAFYYSRRRGHLRGRGPLIAAAVLIGILVAYGMTGGFFPQPSSG